MVPVEVVGFERLTLMCQRGWDWADAEVSIGGVFRQRPAPIAEDREVSWWSCKALVSRYPT